MSHDLYYLIAVIAVAAVVTWFTRAFPFLLFGNRPLPSMVTYLGNVFPPAIMIILVIYCLRNTDFGTTPHGVSEILSCAVVLGIQKVFKNLYVSIVLGTICYMVMIRVIHLQ